MNATGQGPTHVETVQSMASFLRAHGYAMVTIEDADELFRRRMADTRPADDEARALLEALEAKATAAVEAIDAYNAENGTHLGGPAVFQLAASLHPARTYLTRTAEQ